MIACPNFNIPSVKAQFNELIDILGEKIAYAVWSGNGGHPIEFAKNGQPSILFKNLLIQYPRREAIRRKAEIFKLNYFSSDLDENGEPRLVDDSGIGEIDFEDIQQPKHPKVEAIEQDHYIIDGVKYKRVAEVLKDFKQNKKDESWYDTLAKKIWGSRPPETQISLSDGVFPNMQAYSDYLQEQEIVAQAKGKIAHLYIQQYINPHLTEEIDLEIKRLSYSHKISPYAFNWLKETEDSNPIKYLIKRMGSNFVDNLEQDYQRDKILSEVTIKNDILGIAGTADMIVQHFDGSESIHDFKFGKGFNRPSNYLLKYYNGINKNIYSSSRDLANLQVTLYAFLRKLEKPDVKFRNLTIQWIPNENELYTLDDQMHIDVADYLAIIKDWLKAEHLEMYKTLDSSFFDPKEYMIGYQQDLTKFSSSPSVTYNYLKNQITTLNAYLNAHPNLDETTKYQTKQKIVYLTKQLIDIKGTPGINYSAWNNDISMFSQYLGTLTDIKNPNFQLFQKIFNEQMTKFDEEYQNSYRNFLAKLRPVYLDYQKRNNKVITDSIPLLKGQINFTDYQDLYEPLYVKISSEGISSFRWRQEHEWEDAKKLFNLTDSEINNLKELLNFMLSTYDQFFIGPEALWNKTAFIKEIQGKKENISWGDLHNGVKNKIRFRINAPERPFVYNRDNFIPMVYITPEEVRAKHGTFSKEHLDYQIKQYTTMFEEREFERWYDEDIAIPFRFLPNEQIMTQELFTVNVEMQFDRFVRNALLKKHLDEVYAIGKGFQAVFETKKTHTGAPMLRSADTLETMLKMYVQGKTQKDLSLGGRSRYSNLVQVIKTFKKAISAPLMWFKVIPATANFLQASILNHKEAIKGSLVSRRTDINPAFIDFTETDLLAAYGHYTTLQADAMTGKLSRNKLFLIAKTFRYLADDYKFRTSEHNLLTQRNKVFSSRTPYLFYALPEEAVSLHTLAAQMERMRMPANHPTHANIKIIDMYEVVDIEGVPTLRWKLDQNGKEIVRAVVNISKDPNKPEIKELTKLTSQEITKMKAVHQRIQGSYREDERNRLQYWVLGDLFMQYKQYLPSILKNALQDRGQLEALGRYVSTEQVIDGKPEVKWEIPIVEGRWKLLTKWLLSYIAIRDKYDKPTNAYQKVANIFLPTNSQIYKWENLTDNDRIELMDAMTGLSMMFYGFLAKILIFGSGNTDDSWYKFADRILNDFSQQYNPWEISKNTLYNLTPVTFRKFHKIFMATTDMFISALMYTMEGDEALTSTGQLRGTSEMLRSIPFISAYNDFVQFLMGQDLIESENYLIRR